MPGDRGQTVVARLESRPSGAVRTASFMVMSHGSVMAMNQTLQRLMTRSTAGEGRTMTMEDGSEMPMPQAWPIATARKATAVGRRDRRGDESPTPVLVTLRAPPGGCADHPGG